MQQVDLTSATFRNPRKQGDIGLSAAIFYFTRLGYEVFVPMTEATRVDLIVIPPDGGPPQRVQCKTTRQKTSDTSYTVSLVTAGGNRSGRGTRKGIEVSQVDLVFVWCADDSMWVFPSGALSGQSTVALGWANRKFQVSGSEPSRPHASKFADEAGGQACEDCKTPITSKALRCRRCAQLKRNASKIEWPTPEQVRALIETTGSVLAASRVLGVSDNAVRRWLARRESSAA